MGSPTRDSSTSSGPRRGPALSVGGTRPRPGLQLLRAWTVPGQGPCAGTWGRPSLHTDYHLAGAQGWAKGKGLRGQEPGISGCRQFASNLLARHKRCQWFDTKGRAGRPPRTQRGRQLASHLPWAPASDPGSGSWIVDMTCTWSGPGPPLLPRLPLGDPGPEHMHVPWSVPKL